MCSVTTFGQMSVREIERFAEAGYSVIRRQDFEASDAGLAQSARFFDGPYGAYLVFGGLHRPSGFVEIP